MASFSVTVNGAAVPVMCSPNSPSINLEACVKSKLLLDWAASVQTALDVREIYVSSVDYFGPRIGFLKIETVTFFQGVRIPGICFLRGGAVSILVVLECEGTKYVILTTQPRVPVGSAALLELPAGMLDGSAKFAGVAAKELREETGLDLTEADLTDVTAAVNKISGTLPVKGMLPSAGGCDEFLRLMFHKKLVTRAELDAMQGKATGLLEEGEVIKLRLVEYDQVWKICADAKLLSSMFLCERLGLC